MFLYRNIPNIVSILGVLPLALLFLDNGFQYIIPLIIFNNIMDDLDGALASKLNLRSKFGADLDNVCDAVAHSLIVIAVGIHFGTYCSLVAMLPATAIILRIVTRLQATDSTCYGSPTNELTRHIMFVICLSTMFSFNPEPYLMIVFVLNTISMLIKIPMPHLICNQVNTHLKMVFLNLLMISILVVPMTAPYIIGIFIVSYIYSFLALGVVRFKDIYALKSHKIGA